MENGMQMTLEQLNPEICQTQTATVSDFHASLSRLLDTDEVLKIREELSFLRSCGLLKSDTLKYYSQKMSKDYSTMMGGATFGTIIRTMDELGYDVEWQVCNSKHFGVPQNRERVFIIGHFRGESGRKVFPITADDNAAPDIQGHIVSNTITARTGEAEQVGTYLVDGGGVMKVNGYHQGVIAGFKCEPRGTEIASTLAARDYKGVSNQGMTVVYETDTDNIR